MKKSADSVCHGVLLEHQRLHRLRNEMHRHLYFFYGCFTIIDIGYLLLVATTAINALTACSLGGSLQLHVSFTLPTKAVLILGAVVHVLTLNGLFAQAPRLLTAYLIYYALVIAGAVILLCITLFTSIERAGNSPADDYLLDVNVSSYEALTGFEHSSPLLLDVDSALAIAVALPPNYFAYTHIWAARRHILHGTGSM